jgi:hypothetical protein
MNISVIAIFTVVFCVPGYLFIRNYYSSSFSIKFTKIDVYHELLFSLIPSFIIHASAIYITKKLGYNLNFHEDLIRFNKSTIDLLNYISLRGLVFYNLYVWGSAILAGHIARRIVQVLGWDKIFEFLRYPNSYHYLLSGEIKDIEFINRTKGLKKFVLMAIRPSRKIELKIVDVLVKVNSSLILYRGILKHYTLASDNKLDKLYLSSTYKSKYRENCSEEHTFKRIPGAYFVIDGNDIVNINIAFYELIPEDEHMPE